MAKNQPGFLTASSTQISELCNLAARGNGFFHITAREVPSVIPSKLRAKWDSAVVIVSGSVGSNRAVAIVGHRIDEKANMMDHDPFLIEVSTLVSEARGVLVHHASFPRRSVPLPSDINSPSTESHFKNNPTFGLSSGSTGQLPEPLFQAYKIANRALSSTSAST